ncbi:YgaP family membrane protein [Thioalkalivibrio thiocyanodenitrificans]|uniref:YgaP family membrane protein n=1 Tax=Thioalkalivibrio thiocyanodenitrificans TaxID=243063 RepID=UPI00037AA968
MMSSLNREDRVMDLEGMKNMGTVDRALRAIVGLVLISLVFVGPQTPWGWIGIIPLATAVISWCPAYSLLGMRTCK